MTDPAGVIFKTKPDALRSPPKPASTPASEAAVTRTPKFEDPVISLISEVSEQLVGLIEVQRMKFYSRLPNFRCGGRLRRPVRQTPASSLALYTNGTCRR
jgi:hypothetical protein